MIFMNKTEYEARKQELEQDKSEFDESDVTDTDIQDMLQQADNIQKPGEKDEDDDTGYDSITELTESQLQEIPELEEFMQTEEFMRLGTKARIPVPLDINGHMVKVFVRALSSNEMEEIRVEARNKKEDANYLAALKVCTDSNGKPYPSKVLEQLGYARIRDIGEAISIASGESAEITQAAITKRVIDNFLND